MLGLKWYKLNLNYFYFVFKWKFEMKQTWKDKKNIVINDEFFFYIFYIEWK